MNTSCSSFLNDAVRIATLNYEPTDGKLPYPICVAGVVAVSALVFAIIVSLKGGPLAIRDALAKSGFTAAFALIFVSEIGDKVRYHKLL